MIVRIHYTERITTNPLTCISTSRDEGTYMLVGGTRAFAGASGGGTFTVNGTFIGARGARGCLADAPPVNAVLVLRGVGTTYLPGQVALRGRQPPVRYARRH